MRSSLRNFFIVATLYAGESGAFMSSPRAICNGEMVLTSSRTSRTAAVSAAYHATCPAAGAKILVALEGKHISGHRGAETLSGNRWGFAGIRRRFGALLAQRGETAYSFEKVSFEEVRSLPELQLR